ncbi:hypothetical protein VP01_7605g1 [Puccinia sorghi]|uniref:No apical meristem-associated C-terminal domain-containing protein n=1 Tax=Puccinia sorghi TaxID=27349 RepID=A0A0L6UCS8_9BASI|nr:hypothetical protein VP01_7605g1 [Puccinia sorghi]
MDVILDTNKKNKKQKTRKHNQMLAQLTPSERALDESSKDEIPKKPNQSLEKESPNNTSKGKQTPNPFKSYKEYASKKDEGKTEVARDGIIFEMLKFEWQVKNDEKGVELEEEKFKHLVALEEKKWDHRIKLEEKKLDWEKEEKEKDRSFEMAKLERLASKENIGKTYELITQCVISRKSTEEIEQLANFFKWFV